MSGSISMVFTSFPSLSVARMGFSFLLGVVFDVQLFASERFGGCIGHHEVDQVAQVPIFLLGPSSAEFDGFGVEVQRVVFLWHLASCGVFQLYIHYTTIYIFCQYRNIFQ
jgi:hypothetical protein